MNGDENVTSDADGTTRVVTAKLPNGVPTRVGASGVEPTDGMVNVGLKDLNLGKASEAPGDISSAVVEELEAASPARQDVDVRLDRPSDSDTSGGDDGQ